MRRGVWMDGLINHDFQRRCKSSCLIKWYQQSIKVQIIPVVFFSPVDDSQVIIHLLQHVGERCGEPDGGDSRVVA